MAISNLVTGGQSFERPSVSAFFGKNPAGSNDNVQRVSSDFLTKDIVKSIVGAIDSIGKELSKLQDTSKNIIKSFDTLIKNTRDLNRDVTKRFRDVNDQLNRSKIDFLRSIMTTPVASSGISTTMGDLTSSASAAGASPALGGGGGDTSSGGSWLGTLLDVGSSLKDAWDLKKSVKPGATGAPANAAKEAAKNGSKWSRFLGWLSKKSPVLFRSVGTRIAAAGAGLALPGPGWLWTAATVLGSLGTAWEIYQLYKEFSGQDMNDEAVKDPYARGVHDADEQGYLPDTEMNSNRSLETIVDSSGKASETFNEGIISERSEDGSTMKMNTFAKKGTQTGVMMGTSMKSDDKGIAELKEFFGQRVSGGFMKRDTYTVQYKGKDLDLRKTEYFQVRNAVEAGDYETAFKMLDKLALRKDREEWVAKGNKPSDYGKKLSDNITADSELSEEDLKQKRIAGLAERYGLNPANVSATLEGGVPTSITSDGKTIDVYNDLTEDERKKVQLARESKSGKAGEAQQTSPTAPAAAPAGGGTEGAGGPDQQQATPPAPGGGTEGAGAPEKAPAPSGGGAGTGGGETPAGAPTPAAPAPAPSASSTGESGAGAGTTESTPSAPSGSAVGTAEGTAPAGSPAATGAPEATPPAPSTPPAPPATPEPSSSNEPIVMNNNTTQNNAGSVGNSENAGLAGQNFPLEAQNDKIKEYLAKQNIGYQ